MREQIIFKTLTKNWQTVNRRNDVMSVGKLFQRAGLATGKVWEVGMIITGTDLVNFRWKMLKNQPGICSNKPGKIRDF